MMQAICSGTRKLAALALLFCVVVFSARVFGQDAATSDDPMTTVQHFKTSLDAEDVTAMCELMAESDGSGPLKRLHFETMQSSMSELIKLWRYVPFSYDAADINTDKTPNKANVRVTVSQLKHQVRFSLLKFDSSWYIADVEIYFK